MLTFRRILFPTDFSDCAQQAFGHAVHWARRHDAELHLLHVVVLDEESQHDAAHYVEDSGDLWDRLENRAGESVANLLEAHGATDLRTVTEVQRAISPAQRIKEYVDEAEIDLVVMGTHGRRGFRALVVGSVAEETLREASCPVLLVRQREHPCLPCPLKSVLVPLDFSEFAPTAVRYAKAIAESDDATVVLLHVVESAVLPDFYYSVSNAVFLNEPVVRDEARASLERLAEEPGHDVRTEIHVIGGRAALDISRFAKDHEVDLIVIPTHGLSGVDRLLLGSVTDKVLRHSPCPVLALKPFGRQPLIGVESDPEAVEESTEE